MKKAVGWMRTLGLAVQVCGVLSGQGTVDPRKLLKLSLQELMDIPITSASKRSESSLESPQAVEVITADQIRAAGVFRLSEILQLATSIQVWELDRQRTSVSIRGLAPSLAPKTVQVLVDGMPLYNTKVLPVSMDDLPIPVDAIDRVEIVRGPSSTLYGANAQLGVISIITKGASTGTTGSLRLAAAGAGVAQGQAFISCGTGGFGLAAGAGGFSVRDSGQTQRAVGGSFTYDPSDPWHGSQVFLTPEFRTEDGRFWAMFARSDRIGNPERSLNYLDATAPAPTALYAFPYFRNGLDITQAGWSREWSPTFRTEGKLNSATTHFRLGPLQTVPGFPGSAGLVAALKALDPGFNGEYDIQNNRDIGATLQVNWDPSAQVHLVAGADASRITADPLPVNGLQAMEVRARGGFLSAEWSGGPLVLSGGLRVENETLGGSRTSPRVSVIYRIDGRSILRAGYFTSTRSPQFTEVFNNLAADSPQPQVTIPNPGLRPEESDNLELGYRRTFGKWSLDLTLFSMTLKKLIAATYTGAIIGGKPVVQFTNGPNTYTDRGVELTVRGEPAPGWTLGLNAATVAVPDVVTGLDQQADYAPRVTANGWTRLRTGAFFAYAALQVQGAYTRLFVRGSTNLRETQESRVQAHFNVGFEPTDGLSVSIYGINAARPATPTGNVGIDNGFLTRFARRELGLQAAWRF